jgi:predicted glutamine amidotransferase
MCGLVGVAGNLFGSDVNAFNQMLYADVFRGQHATGVASVNSSSVRLLKRAMSPQDLQSLKAYEQLVNMQAHVLIGHNRHGTRGDNYNPNNAHPFMFENVVGAHNGTLDYSCLKNLHNAENYGTDSEALYSEINQNGIDAAIDKAGGAWALTFFDRKAGTLNFLRNDQRPLYFAYKKKDRSVLYWASEFQMMYWILSRNNIDIEDDLCFELPPNTLYTWKVSMNGMGEPVKREVKSSFRAPTYAKPKTEWQNGMTWDSDKKDWVWPNGRKPEDKKNDEPPFPVDNVVNLPKSGSQPGKSTGPNTKPTGTDSRGDLGLTKRADPRPYINPATGRPIGRQFFGQIMHRNCCAYCGRDDAKWGEDILFLETQNSAGMPDFLCETCNSIPTVVELATGA